MAVVYGHARGRIRARIAMAEQAAKIVNKQAVRWFTRVLLAEDLASELPKLHAWFRKNPAHRVAFESFQRTRRLITPLLKASEPGAESHELQRFYEVLHEERVRARKEFAN